ncbi:MAG: hypothetical protein CMB16_07030 [Euryarchaeota archaeon]|nr:hypothetical protein [Euryarchaeota archaeon]|tara:strand:+ start:9125 stop:10009 length:885 start_codon:yes stop_codon:yes gene_type:complete
MKTTYRMMGLADYITITNGLLGTCAIFLLLLAVEDISENPYQSGIKTDYVWAAMLCILLSALGDIIDGPIARRYSKRQLLGGSLDIMSDCISFCVAPALLVFVMFGRWGGASPIWTISLAIACCWLIACGMLRLARFQHDEGGYVPYFFGLSSPASAMFVISAAGLIWLQPSSGIGPDLSTWSCDVCFGEGDHPYLDFTILPIMLISGGLMISDRKMSKLKSGFPLRLSVMQFAAVLFAVIHAMSFTDRDDFASDLDGTAFTMLLFSISLVLILVYITLGPSIVEDEMGRENEE